LRARKLARQHPAHQAALHFYEKVLGFQSEVARASINKFRTDDPLRSQIDPAFVSSKIPAILALTAASGPEILREDARSLMDAGAQRWQSIAQESLDSSAPSLSDAERFFSRACVQPIAESLQRQLPKPADYGESICPACGGLPQMAVLRPEGEGSSRCLLCSFCLREWLFRRICCCWCGEVQKEKLPRYTAEECDYIYVEACESCKRYFKAVDMSVNGLAVPLVDEAAWAVLDVWATSRGYEKIIQNLLGF